MKIIYLDSYISKKKNPKASSLDCLRLKATKRFLKKYKPRDLYIIEAMSNRKDKKRVV